MTLNRDTIEGLRTLQGIAWGISEAKGFHLDHPFRGDFVVGLRGDAAFATAKTNYDANRMMLIVGEASEAHEQLRDGRTADETYYPSHKPGCAVSDWKLFNSGPEDPQPNCTCVPKPEGVPSEIADVVIRCFDFAQASGIDLAAMIDEKLTYNATRPFKHGKKF